MGPCALGSVDLVDEMNLDLDLDFDRVPDPNARRILSLREVISETSDGRACNELGRATISQALDESCATLDPLKPKPTRNLLQGWKSPNLKPHCPTVKHHRTQTVWGALLGVDDLRRV